MITKDTFVEKVLEFLQSEAEVTVDLLNSFLLSKSEARRDYHRFLRHGPRQFKTDWADLYRKRRQFFNTLNYLRREGLIKRNENADFSIWSITKYGLKRLKNIRQRKKNLFSSSTAIFDSPSGGGITVVAFDIPESAKKARAWIRRCLKEMEFKMLQKSVWVSSGSVMDEDFVHALRERNLLNYVHIFSVNKRGTINKG